MSETREALPKIVSAEEWLRVREQVLVKEKDLTRQLYALAAERRRLPMVRIEKNYNLFDGRRQLIVYHFMFAPGGKPCTGCSSFADNIGHLAHLRARDTSLVLVSRAPHAEILPYKQRMGWTVPWVSSFRSDFNYDFRVTTQDGESFGLSAFLRDGEAVYRTYFTTARGADRLRIDFNLLDLTPLGRQEEWEDSPEGWPQSPPYVWWRKHDEYGDTASPKDIENRRGT
ncbi:MAG: DUF899 domain-containing protein [Bacillati bacterium ANGP1]|uniref:DUF899 domain-containing protein n=1 Tax=Candidatus Segetimicrobium genomatis TaxID=2569760 RepID=A0A537JEW9_9BACT|nr:MAG: DUF899 domain-containing protein [Terrabacteria group bacterium ANGP1]